jgi:hypothetical protein
MVYEQAPREAQRDFVENDHGRAFSQVRPASARLGGSAARVRTAQFRPCRCFLAPSCPASCRASTPCRARCVR